MNTVWIKPRLIISLAFQEHKEPGGWLSPSQWDLMPKKQIPVTHLQREAAFMEEGEASSITAHLFSPYPACPWRPYCQCPHRPGRVKGPYVSSKAGAVSMAL